jgi:hypothetical protein
MRILNAYDSSFHYRTKTFKEHVYKSHRQVDIICYVSIVSFVASVMVVDKLKL